MSSRPRILLVTRNLPPLVGGMERLNWHMADELSRHADVHVVGPAGAARHCPQAVELTEVPLRPLWKFLAASALQARRIARAWRPDIVLAGSGLTAPAAYLSARAVRARSAAYIHGLDITVRHAVYQGCWLPAIRRIDTILVNSTPTRSLAIDAGVSAGRISIVPPGVALREQPASDTARRVFLDRYDLQGRRILLSVGRLTSRKGLKEFVLQALPQVVVRHPDATLVVIGDVPGQALSAEAQTPRCILEAAQQAGVAGHVKMLGVVDDATLDAAFDCSSVHIFPIRHVPGDPEGFGMVAIEAAAHGLPTVAFATGGVVDAVASGRSGLLVAPGDYRALAQAVSQVLAGRSDAWRDGAVGFARGFAWPVFGDRLRASLHCPAQPAAGASRRTD